MNHRADIAFGTDGIRGIAGQYPLDPATVLGIGRAIGQWLRTRNAHKPLALAGRDTRISGNMLLHALAGGLLAEGVDVVDAGVITTPGVAHLVRTQAVDLGIVISASHNPVEQNGIKLFGPDGFKLDDGDEEAIETRIAALDLAQPVAISGMYRVQPDQAARYIAHLADPFGFREFANLTLVLDCANGAASAIAPKVFGGNRGAKIILHHAAPDGLNINVGSGSEHVRRDRLALLDSVRASGADLGIAFDGDADRVVFVTPEGMLVDGDHLLGILALEMKAQGKLPGDTVVATDMSNSGLEHFLQGQGIALSRTKVGDRYVMERMREQGYVLGGEQAGHIIILDGEHTVGDGLYIGLLVAALVARNKRESGPTLQALAARIPRYPQVIASVPLNSRIDLAAVPGLAVLQGETLAAFEGKGRVNLRFSGTEPNLLRAMVEGGPQTTLDEVIARALALCGLVAEATGTADPAIDIVDCVTGAPVRR